MEERWTVSLNSSRRTVRMVALMKSDKIAREKKPKNVGRWSALWS